MEPPIRLCLPCDHIVRVDERFDVSIYACERRISPARACCHTCAAAANCHPMAMPPGGWRMRRR